MNQEFRIKQGDTRPLLEAQLQDASDCSPRSLVQADTVTFHMRDVDTGSVVVEGSGTILDAQQGIVYYEWNSGDTDTAGRFKAEFEVTYADGGIETFPNYGDITVYVTEEIA